MELFKSAHFELTKEEEKNPCSYKDWEKNHQQFSKQTAQFEQS